MSLSHRAGRALAAVGDAGAALGADLELVEPRSALRVADFFTATRPARSLHARRPATTARSP